MSNVTEQEVHQGALQRQFFGRAKLLVRAAEMVKQVQTKGGMMLVEGGPGEGKTVFMVNFMIYIGKLVCLFTQEITPSFISTGWFPNPNHHYLMYFVL